MKKFDITILFLFATQIYIYFTKSISTNFYIKDLFSANKAEDHFAFFLYCFSFIFLFSNFFSLFFAFKTDDNNLKRKYILIAFIGTILFFIANFGFEILMIKIKTPLY